MDSQPTGAADQPRDFDHSAFKGWAEWQAAREAIDALARRLDQDDWGGGRPAWIEMCADLARTSYAGDMCENCDTDESVHPYKVEWTGSGIDGRYRCPRCGLEWTCYYGYPPAKL